LKHRVWCLKGYFPGMLEEAERTQALPQGEVAYGVAALGRETEHGCCEAKAEKGNVPRRMKPRRARDAARGEIRRWPQPAEG